MEHGPLRALARLIPFVFMIPVFYYMSLWFVPEATSVRHRLSIMWSCWVLLLGITDSQHLYRITNGRILPTFGIGYMNLGIWNDTRTSRFSLISISLQPDTSEYEQAANRLVYRLAEMVKLSECDSVLDAGFGGGNQDLLWAYAFRPQRIIGLDISENQIATAKKAVEANLHGLGSPSLDLRYGDAVNINDKAAADP